MDKYETRKEIPNKYKWNLDEFYKNEKEFKKELSFALKEVNSINKYINCTKDSKKLYEYLSFDIKLESKIINLYVYAMLLNDVELGNSTNIKRLGLVENLYSKYISMTSFFNPELLNLSSKEYKNLFKNKDLKEFKCLLDEIYRYKGHILTENEERIISEICNSMDHFETISSNMINNEHDYGSVNINKEKEDIRQTNLRRLLKNKNQKIRKEIYEKYRKVLNRYGQTSASLLDSFVKKNNTISKLRNFKSAWDEHLFSEKLTQKEINTLVCTVENNTDILQKYFKVYKKYLGLKELNFYDLYLDITDSKKEYSIEEAISIVRKAIEPLGKEYLDCYDKIINNNYIDYCEHKGKQSGGYNVSTNDRDSRILMSFNYDFISVSTIAHECGHNVNHQLIQKNNPLQYMETSTMIAEVTSLTNECLLSSYVAKNAKTKEEKIVGIKNIIDVIISNLYGAVREGKMEYDFYDYSLRGNSITKEYMNDLTNESLKKYYGNLIKIDEYSGITWVSRSHYYNPFYLYSYSFAISVACYVANNILNGNKEILNRYLKFLTVGSDKTIKEAYKILNIDLEDKKVYEEAIAYFEKLVNDLEIILNS